MPRRLSHRVTHGVYVRIKILLVGMRSKPCDRFTNTDVERLGELQVWNEPFDFRIVEYSGVRLIALQRANHLRRDLANQIGWHSDDVRIGHTQGGGDFRRDLIPSEDFVTRDLERFSEGLALAHKPGEACRKIAGSGQSPAVLAIVGQVDRFALFHPLRERVAGTGHRVWNPSFGIGV